MLLFLIKSCSINKFILIACAVIFLLSSCTHKTDTKHIQLKKQLIASDSLITDGKGDSAMRLLARLRPQITSSDPLICTYYCLQAQHYLYHPKTMNLYADSALAFFTDDEKINQFPNEYFQSLLTKGDACLKAKNYVDALDYYYKGEYVLSHADCDNGELADKIGNMYFNQKNYYLAAKYMVESYHLLIVCHQKTSIQKLFFMEQGVLNNAGYCFERAGKLDSANYYYSKDLDLINKTNKNGLVNSHYTTSALRVVYDNLGGLNLREGNLSAANDYLTKCIAIPEKDVDGSTIPPLVKLAALYIKTGDNDKAKLAFTQSKALLNHFSKFNREAEIDWNKLYAQYLFKTGQTDSAYHYQSAYIQLKDSLENGSSSLYRLDVERELNMIRQNEMLTALKHKNKEKKIYLIGFSIIVALSIAIILMINQILKTSKENHRDISNQNQQLQKALNELERVNQNYIRIMRVMAHDLRNPISGITGLAGMLIGEGEFSKDSKMMLKLIETTGMHSLEMINELLKSGLSDENEKLETQKLDLQALVYDSIELLQFKAKEKQQVILFESDSASVMADVNYEKIWRVINNLVVNAIKFSHPGGTIKVGIKEDKDHIILSVADNGIGIPADAKDSVFEIFTPAKKLGTNGEQAFGLGLSISKRIIEMHKGRIWFENNGDTGTVFYIELPVIKQ
jgi:signal transduction histidine kinase